MISTITLAELEHGVENSLHQRKNRKALDEFVAILEILPFDDKAARIYGKIRTALQKQPIGPLDMLIAAHALSLGVPLITNSTKEFKRVTGLSLQN